MSKWRLRVQLAATTLLNSAYLFGQTRADRVYQGALKQVCSPGLNCYACPWAVTACPVGSLQHLLGEQRHQPPFYLAGLLLLFGTAAGRWICGWLCPFGFVQDLLQRIPSPKLRLPRPLRRLPWAVLLILVVYLPLRTGLPAFCRYLCPAGTLEGGVPFVMSSAQVRSLIGGLFFLKLSLLIIFLGGSIFISRLFCRTACPLGLIYGFFNRVALLNFEFEPDRCLDCGRCSAVCPVGLQPQRGEFASGDCIRCLRCRDICPVGCFYFGPFPSRRRSTRINSLPQIPTSIPRQSGRKNIP